MGKGARLFVTAAAMKPAQHLDDNEHWSGVPLVSWLRYSIRSPFPGQVNDAPDSLFTGSNRLLLAPDWLIMV